MKRNGLSAAATVVAVILMMGFVFSGVCVAASPTIKAISVCGARPVGAVHGARPAPAFTSNCAGGTFDTGQAVLSPVSGRTINDWGSRYASDEHSSVLPPQDWTGSNGDYLFFVASGPKTSACCGVQALSSLSAGPNESGQWALQYAPGYPAGQTVGNQGFGPPWPFTTCDGKDERFDLNYAAPGSVVPDPFNPSGLLMVYEPTNKCSSGASQSNGYHMVGIATSRDDGKTWPVYPTSDTTDTTPWQSFWFGGTGASYCAPGAPCNPLSSYGRYAVLSPSPSLYADFNANNGMGRDASGAELLEQQPSAFLDTSQPGSPTLYVTVGHFLSSAAIVDGTTPLTFDKWTNGRWAPPPTTPEPAGDTPDGNLNDTPDTPLLTANGNYSECQGVKQVMQGLSINYYAATKQYLLLFVCRSPSDPNPVKSEKSATTPGAAWFWATTSPGATQPTNWTTFREISGSWSPINNGRYTGWYPSAMSLRQQPGQLTASGYVFYMVGCLGKSSCTNGASFDRTYSSRAFAIQTTNNLYAHAPKTTLSLKAQPFGELVTLKSNEPGSVFRCQQYSGPFKPCPAFQSFNASGTYTLRARATNSFGISGPPSKVTFTIKQITPGCKLPHCPQPT